MYFASHYACVFNQFNKCVCSKRVTYARTLSLYISNNKIINNKQMGGYIRVWIVTMTFKESIRVSSIHMYIYE